MKTKILAVASSGGMGDLLAATPAMRAIARHFGTTVDVLTSPYAAPLLQDQAFVGDVHRDDGTESARVLASRLALPGFTHAVVFWSTARIAAAIRRANIDVRVGQARRLYSWSYTCRVTVRSELGDTKTHWTDILMDYARALGAQPQPGDYDVRLNLRRPDLVEAEDLLREWSVGEEFIVLHAARGIPLERVQWPVQRFAAIADALQQEFSLPLLLTGSAADAPTIATIGGLMQRPGAVVAGRTSVMGLAAVLSKAALVVALDSGPLHLAAALGAPTVGIFALRTDLPDRWRPMGKRVAVVRPSYPCPSWHRKETCRNFACYADLAPEAVLDAAHSILSRVPHKAALPGL